MKIRYYLALWIAKLSIIALKITGHNGTNFPGVVALKICPEFLKYSNMPEKIIGITGTNGKTTIANLLVDMLHKDGKEVMQNNMGSNTIYGIITSLIYGVNVLGKCKCDTAVIEIDERSSRLLFSSFQPDYLLINNLTRDSIMRNGHPEFISGLLSKHMPSKTRLILNGDDLIASSVAPDNERVYFGIDRMDTDVDKCINLINDMQICPKCGNMLSYEYLRYHHIGKAYCSNCGFKSPECDYLAHNVDTGNMTVEVSYKDENKQYKLLNDSVFKIYNVVAVVAVMREIGYAADRIAELLEQVNIVQSRYSVIESGEYRVIRQMSKDKNALGASRVFDYISHQPNKKEIILMMNCLDDQVHWSENVCWLYDADFEFLNNELISNIVCTGPRCKDYYLRLKMAGISDDRISLVETETSTPSALKLDSPEDVYVLFGTDSIELAEKVAGLIDEEIKERGK